MRSPIFLLSLITSLSVSAQTTTDTTFWDQGTTQQVHHFSLMKSSDLSPADMFSRGIHLGDEITEIRVKDSIHFYDESGVYLKTKFIQRQIGPSSPVRDSRRKNEVIPKREEMLVAKPSAHYLEGRAGMLVRQKIWLPNGKAFDEIRRLDQYPGIEILQTPADTNGSFTAKIRIPAGASTPKLRLDVGEETDWEKPFSLRGYHLNETDFKRRDQLTDEHIWTAEDRDYLYLRLRSTEKLMHIYRDGEQYTVLPVGRQLDEVRVGGLPAGRYLLEIIDLGTREKRYYWLVME